MKRSFIWTLVLAIVFAAVPTLAKADDTADLYKAKCQTCHGPDGKGSTPVGQKLGARDFSSPAVAKESESEMFDITKNGKNKMPGYDKKLTDDQIKDLVKYVRSLK